MLVYNYTGENGLPAKPVERTVVVVDKTGPIITINGEASITLQVGETYDELGASATDPLDGELPVYNSQSLPMDNLVMHLDAASLEGYADGSPINIWPDLAGDDDPLNDTRGIPTYRADGINGLPTIHFDGSAQMATTRWVDKVYTVLTVSRLGEDSNGRLIASKSENWALGYLNGMENVMYAQSWTSTDKGPQATTQPHLYSAVGIAANNLRFYADGEDLTLNNVQNRNLGYFQLGAAWENSNPATGDVSEVLLYSVALDNAQRTSAETYLNAKYNLKGYSGNVPVDTSRPGTYHVLYASTDSSGNITSARRTVIVEAPEDAPIITLNGASILNHEAGTEFEDPGASITDAAGNPIEGAEVTIEGTISLNSRPGRHVLTYSYSDIEGKAATPVTRQVFIQDTQPPTITLTGEPVLKLAIGDSFTDPGVTATDAADGIIHVVSDNILQRNALLHKGFKQNNINNDRLNFENDGGLFQDSPAGEKVFTTGPANRGINFENDGRFRSAGVGINVNDHFQNLFTGYLRAPADGIYHIQVASEDDAASVWLDLDQDGTFEATGDNGSELLYENYATGNKPLDLSHGLYRIAIGHRERIAGSRLRINFYKPAANRPAFRMVLQPSHPEQDGYWFTSKATPTVDTSEAGEYIINYSATDLSGNSVTAIRRVVVVEDATLPFISLKGEYSVLHEAATTFTDPGATVTDKDGNVIEADLKGEGSVDISKPANYSLEYSYTDEAGTAAEKVLRTIIVADTTAPVITLEGPEILELTVGDTYTEPGVSATDTLDGDLTPDSSLLPPARGLHTHLKFDETDGLNAKDSISGHDGTLINMTGDEWVADGKVGGALLLDGTNQHLTLTPFEYGGPTTLSIWVQWKKLGRWARIIGFGNGPNDHIVNITRTDKGNARFSVYQGGNNLRVETNNFWVVDQWMHVAASVDADGVFKLYKDGQLAATNPNGQFPASITRQNYYIGRSNWDENEYFNGLVDDLRIYNRPLADTEIQTLAQNGSPIDTSSPAHHLVTYSVEDAAGNLATATRTVVVKPDPAAPVITILGSEIHEHEAGTEFIDPGVKITDGAGNLIPDAKPTTTPETFDNQTIGTATLTYNYTDEAGKIAIPVIRTIQIVDKTPPTITLHGEAVVTLQVGSVWEDLGAIATDSLDGDITPTIHNPKPTYTFIPGLLKGTLLGAQTLDKPNSGNLGIAPVGPTDSELRAGGAWSNNTTIVYSGQIYDDDGDLTFYENIDDSVHLVIDGQTVLDNSAWNVPSQGAIQLGKGGWYDFELRLGNGTGGFGPAVADQIGFGYDPTRKSTSTNPADYTLPRNTNPENADLFRVRSPNLQFFDASTLGEFIITYTATDSAGYTSTATRTIIVEDDLTLPVISLNGNKEIQIEAGTEYTDAGATVADRRGNALDADQIKTNGTVDPTKLGTYIITYDYSTEQGATALNC